MSWWVGFHVVILAFLALDLAVFHRRRHAVSVKEALAWSIFWIVVALVFYAGLRFGWVGGFPVEERHPRSLEFFTAYLLEESLSLDNVFVFVVLFRYFKVAPEYQHGVLFWGVVGAMLMRLGMIIGGLALLNRFEWILYVFGALLLWSSWHLWHAHEGEIEPGKNPVLRMLRRLVPMTEHYDGQKFFTRENGRKMATPLFAVLVALETSDVLFAVDSVPAVLGVTRDPFIAYTSNVFAILSLRTLYFLIAGIIERFWLLHYGLALLLAVIGVKMTVLHYFDIDMPVGASLALIAALLGGSMVASLFFKPPQKKSAVS
jgi:tellurite resistance protein TerC